MIGLVIGDIHGNYRSLYKILESYRYDITISIGDVMNAVNRQEDDKNALEEVLSACTAIIVGNHDLMHLYPWAGFDAFNGYKRPYHPKLLATLAEARQSKKLYAAYPFGDILITHAGLHPKYAKQYEDWDTQTVAVDINHRFHQRLGNLQRQDIFDAIGYKRGGYDDVGGIFWNDFSDAAPTSFPQIVGHSAQKGDIATAHNWTCIDVRDHVVGVIVEDGVIVDRLLVKNE